MVVPGALRRAKRTSWGEKRTYRAKVAYKRATRVKRRTVTEATTPSAADVVVIGSGIGGLTCAALAARYGFSVVVVESHTIPGGCAHSFERDGFMFDSGPSFFAGLGPDSKSNNALKQVLDLLDEKVDCAEYNGWKAYLPEGEYKCRNNLEAYEAELFKFGGESALTEWRRLDKIMAPLGKSSNSLSFANFRNDVFLPLTVMRSMSGFVSSGVFNNGPFDAMNMLDGPFSYLLDKANVQNKFLKNLMDLECFVLSGMPASGTLSPEMAYMFQERHSGQSNLDYPIGGSRAIVDALLRGLEKHGGKLLLAKHVSEIIVQDGAAKGVMLSNGEKIEARKSVVSNATIWDTYSKLLSPSNVPPKVQPLVEAIPQLDSFLHLHLGIDGTGLTDEMGIHHLVVNDWECGVSAKRNVVNISIPTVLDKSLAPPGKHLVHAYTAANEPYEAWKGLDRRSQQYKEMKQQSVECIWSALQRVIPDVRERADVRLIGTPLTHERFTRRSRGTYGPAIVAGKQSWPGAKTPIKSLLLCGDSTFPGVGVPAVAASGFIAANTIASLPQHLNLLDDLADLVTSP